MNNFRGGYRISKKLVKFLNQFPAQSYLGYFTCQLTKYQFFQIYYYCYRHYCYIIIIVVIVINIIIIVSAKILERCGTVGFRFHQLVFKPSHKEVLLFTCGRVLPTHFHLQRFSTKIQFLYCLLSSISIFRFFVNSYHLKQPLMRNNWKRLILMKTPTKILLHLICLLENASKQLISF